MSKHPLLHGARGERHVLLGNEAIVRGALEAGVNMVTCYPGTPSSEVPDTFYKLGARAATRSSTRSTKRSPSKWPPVRPWAVPRPW